MRHCFASELAKKTANSHHEATPHFLTRSGIEPATTKQDNNTKPLNKGLTEQYIKVKNI
jgi:hypothetical protein